MNQFSQDRGRSPGGHPLRLRQGPLPLAQQGDADVAAALRHAVVHEEGAAQLGDGGGDDVRREGGAAAREDTHRREVELEDFSRPPPKEERAEAEERHWESNESTHSFEAEKA